MSKSCKQLSVINVIHVFIYENTLAYPGDLRGQTDTDKLDEEGGTLSRKLPQLPPLTLSLSRSARQHGRLTLALEIIVNPKVRRYAWRSPVVLYGALSRFVVLYRAMRGPNDPKTTR